MTFQKGLSGNAAGRPKGIPNKRTQLAKLFEPHAPDLIAKAVELAKGGDVQALRLCLDKIIPRAEHTPIEIELPAEINRTNLPEVNALILAAVIEGRLSIGEAEKLLVLITNLLAMNPTRMPVPAMPIDPVEASKVYQQWMRDS